MLTNLGAAIARLALALVFVLTTLSSPGPVFAAEGANRGVAFTFDDGMSARGIREVLAVAVSKRVPITFFPTAHSLRKFPQLWREISAAGFAIGNHTAGHRALPQLLKTEGAEAVKTSITAWSDAANEIGIQSIPYLRPPYGERSAATDALAGSVGITHVVNWGATFADTAPRCSGTIAKRIAHATSGGEGAIVLAHTGARGRAYEPMTARIFAQVIDSYRARKITPVSLDTMFGAPKRAIDWVLAAKATTAPSRPGEPRVSTSVPKPYTALELMLSPGAAAGVCP